MTDTQQRAAAKNFSQVWKGRGYEKGDSQKFWLQLLGEVYGVEHPAQFIEFEEQVHLGRTKGRGGESPLKRLACRLTTRLTHDFERIFPYRTFVFARVHADLQPCIAWRIVMRRYGAMAGSFLPGGIREIGAYGNGD